MRNCCDPVAKLLRSSRYKNDAKLLWCTSKFLRSLETSVKRLAKQRFRNSFVVYHNFVVHCNSFATLSQQLRNGCATVAKPLTIARRCRRCNVTDLSLRVRGSIRFPKPWYQGSRLDFSVSAQEVYTTRWQLAHHWQAFGGTRSRTDCQ